MNDTITIRVEPGLVVGMLTIEHSVGGSGQTEEFACRCECGRIVVRKRRQLRQAKLSAIHSGCRDCVRRYVQRGWGRGR